MFGPAFMLLAIDIGNSNIVWGVFEGRDLRAHWRLATDSRKTADDYRVAFLGLLESVGIKRVDIGAVIVSSVVPALTPVFEHLAETCFQCQALLVSAESPTGLTIRYQNPHEIGSDRLVNAAAAFARYRTAVIIVDFGTATTFCAVTASGEYLGGAIAPGLGIAADALASRTAKLPRIELIKPKTAIGVDTVSSMQSGLIYGYAGLVDEMVTRINREVGQPAKVVATGGLAPLIAAETTSIEEIRPLLTLEGLALLYRRSQGEPD